MKWQQMVEEFHRKFGVPVGRAPYIDAKRVGLRSSLIMEEAQETVHAMMAGDLAETADGIADLIYVALGAAVEFGIDIDELFAEVHRSNMTKTVGQMRGDGKILKGPTFEPPQIATLLLRQTARAEASER